MKNILYQLGSFGILGAAVILLPLMIAQRLIRFVDHAETRGSRQFKSKQRQNCTLKSLTSGKWVDLNVEMVSSGYRYCAIDTRQDCRNYSSSVKYLSKEFVPYHKHCTIKIFSVNDMRQCLKNRQIIFIGDSLARNQKQSLESMILDHPEENISFAGGYKYNRDLQLSEYNITIRYIKDTLLTNISLIAKSVVASSEDIIVIGTGPWWSPQRMIDEPSLSSIEEWDEFPGGIEKAKVFLDQKVQRFYLN